MTSQTKALTLFSTALLLPALVACKGTDQPSSGLSQRKPRPGGNEAKEQIARRAILPQVIKCGIQAGDHDREHERGRKVRQKDHRWSVVLLLKVHCLTGTCDQDVSLFDHPVYAVGHLVVGWIVEDTQRGG